jgi:hypothetical protein
VFALIEGVRGDPAKGMTSWHATTTWQGQARSRSEIEGYGIGGEKVPRRFSIDIDEPRELGGSNRFANPQEHPIAALNACMTVGYVAQCAVCGTQVGAARLAQSTMRNRGKPWLLGRRGTAVGEGARRGADSISGSRSYRDIVQQTFARGCELRGLTKWQKVLCCFSSLLCLSLGGRSNCADMR